MTIKNLHFPTFDKCKTLTKIGFPETEKCYAESIEWNIEIFDRSNVINSNEEPIYVCPSVMEMIDIIPLHIKYTWNIGMDIVENETLYFWMIGPYPTYLNSDRDTVFIFDSLRLPNALSDMIIWLNERKFISL